MALTTQVQVRFEIRGYPEATGAELSQDLTAWLSPMLLLNRSYGPDRPYEPAVAVQIDSRDPETGSLVVTVIKSNLWRLAHALIEWGQARHLSPNITFKANVHRDAENTAELR